MPTPNMRWNVVEVETGFEDGWYSRYEDAVASRDEYDQRRPEHEHVVLPFFEKRRNRGDLSRVTFG